MPKVTVDRSDLDRLLRRLGGASKRTDALAAHELGELWVAFKTALTGFEERGPGKVQRQLASPGNGIWPVGTRARPIRQDRYVAPGTKGAVVSGRSLRAWRAKVKGMTLTITNAARDNKRRHYAQHAHKAGDPAGQAAEDAADEFVALTAIAGDRMAKAVGSMLRGAERG